MTNKYKDPEQEIDELYDQFNEFKEVADENAEMIVTLMDFINRKGFADELVGHLYFHSKEKGLSSEWLDKYTSQFI